MWNTAVDIENCEQLFSRRLAFTTEKSNTYSGDDVRTICGYFLGRKCKQLWKKIVYSFRYRPGPGYAGVGGGVFHILLRGNSQS